MISPRAALAFFILGAAATRGLAAEPGLLFHLSGEQQLNADFAASGQREPTVARGVTVVPDGAKGSALQCADSQVLAYWAPGNIYAQRGTISFFWRSRYAVGPTEFPIFRVGFADHSSWDMAWLRIDYNGHGFDAFVTDASLARTRVSFTRAPFPAPTAWTHLALSWDETRGIRFYVGGKCVATNETAGVYNVGLDQFGPHSRIISPHQVQSAYNFVRGGDLDELRIYDRMLDDASIARLAQTEALPELPPLAARTLDNPTTRAEWWLRYGWNRASDPPPYLADATTSVRKVEIHETYDLKRWGWKATDGIRETTWPGVYNRSRLPGRHDYFTLPDWDCYVDSGKAVTFLLPDEPWNHLEISGAAWGKMELLPAGTPGRTASEARAESTLFTRAQGQEKTVHRLSASLTGRQIRFTNEQQEEPIGELVAYQVGAGSVPAGAKQLRYRLTTSGSNDTTLAPVSEFIARRHPSDERAMLVAQPLDGAPGPAAPPASTVAAPPAVTKGLPIVHVLVPDNWDAIDGGLDGIVIEIPALPVRATHGDRFALNLQVKDPAWLYRNALDFTFSVKPGEARTLWLDLRDRIMPVGKSFYLTLAGSGGDFSAALLEGAELRLVFKPRAAARAEHEIDRFTQLRDNYAMMAEEHPSSPRLNLWNRFSADLTELIRVNPEHPQGKYYAAAANRGPVPPAALTEPPTGTPLWAWRQVELLRRYQRFANWYIDNRQVAFGDFGGGLSDDTDLVNLFPGLALMGADPEKLSASLERLLDACYKNGMITNGLCTIQADELHSFEEGVNSLGQNLILNYGSPRQLERAMENVRGLEHLTGINAAGHRHIRSSYYSGTKIAAEDPWGWSRPNSYLSLQPAELLVEYNGNPAAKRILLELADGLLAHRKVDATNGRGTLPSTIRFADDNEGFGASFGGGGGTASMYLFWTAWLASGDRKYLEPVFDSGPGAVNANVLDQFNLRKTSFATRATSANATGSGEPVAAAGARDATAPSASAGFAGRGGRGGRAGGRPRGGAADALAWRLTGDKSVLVRSYTGSIEEFDAKEYIYTEGNLWIDRVFAEGTRMADLQETRLGGVAHNRNDLISGHVVSWRFRSPATAQSAAFLIPDATPTGFKVIAHNLETYPVTVAMTGWNIDPGLWDISQGIDTNDDDAADEAAAVSTVPFERTTSIDVTLPPRATTVITLKLKKPGVPYWQRPDLGIDPEDVAVAGQKISVTIHNVGAVKAEPGTIRLVDRAGRTLAQAAIPPIDAPNDGMPKTAGVALLVPAGVSARGTSVVIEANKSVPEITAGNNRVDL